MRGEFAACNENDKPQVLTMAATMAAEIGAFMESPVDVDQKVPTSVYNKPRIRHAPCSRAVLHPDGLPRVMNISPEKLSNDQIADH